MAVVNYLEDAENLIRVISDFRMSMNSVIPKVIKNKILKLIIKY